MAGGAIKLHQALFACGIVFVALLVGRTHLLQCVVLAHACAHVERVIELDGAGICPLLFVRTEFRMRAATISYKAHDFRGYSQCLRVDRVAFKPVVAIGTCRV